MFQAIEYRISKDYGAHQILFRKNVFLCSFFFFLVISLVLQFVILFLLVLDCSEHSVQEDCDNECSKLLLLSASVLSVVILLIYSSSR